MSKVGDFPSDSDALACDESRGGDTVMDRCESNGRDTFVNFQCKTPGSTGCHRELKGKLHQERKLLDRQTDLGTR